MICRFCQGEIIKQLTLTQMLNFKPIFSNHCCESCYLEIVKVDFRKGDFCQYCQEKLDHGNLVCHDCKLWEKNYSPFMLDHHYLYEHSDKMSDYFRQYKFLGDIRMSDTFSGDINQVLKPLNKRDFIVVPIPVSKNRLKTRGFNQVEEFLKQADIPYEKLLGKKREVSSQSEKTREERLKMEQPFFISKKNKRKVTNQSILVVDDVYTTGRTLLYAYEKLIECHPLEIKSFSITR